jgi:sterol 24-C-methyltransferase
MVLGTILKFPFGVVFFLGRKFSQLSGRNKAIVSVIIVAVVYSLRRRKKIFNVRGKISDAKFKDTVKEYAALYEGKDATTEERLAKYTTVVNHYYDVATDFYEWGWGKSFHFAPCGVGESLEQSVARHEYFLSNKLGLHEGMRVLDVGCGVGGPMMAIARFSGAEVTGLNNNAYQISRGTEHVRRAGLSDRCSFLKADFMHIPMPDGSYDAVYEIEATCHAPDRTACYSEINRVLKDGGLFSGFEWCMTDKYDAQNPEHRLVKHNIAIGDGLPDIISTDDVLASLKGAGFEILEVRDLAIVNDANPVPWYAPLAPSYTLKGFKLTPLGRSFSHAGVRVLETVGLAPPGSVKTHEMLIKGAEGLVRGGELGVFTPAFFFVARKRGSSA